MTPRTPRIFLMALAICVTISMTTRADDLIRTGPVKVFGNQDVKTSIILRSILLKEGDPFDYEKLQRSKVRVQEIPGVDFSEIRTYYIPEDSTFGLTVIITEKSTLRGNIWLQRGLETEMSIGVRAATSNFLGRSYELSASALFRGNEIFELGWENPWIGSRFRVGIGVRGLYKQYQYVYDDFPDTIQGSDIRSAGVEFSTFYSWARKRIYLTLRYEQVESANELVTNSDGTTDDLPSATVGIRWDTRSNWQFPAYGAFTHLFVRWVAPGSENINMVEGFVDARIFRTVGEKIIVGAHVSSIHRYGDNNPIYRRSHIGGGTTLRGYDYNTFHGDHDLITGAEIRVPINFSRSRPFEDRLLAFTIHGFADGGVAWDDDMSFSSELFKGTFGVGAIVLNRQIRGFRVDYGWRPGGGGRWDVEIGTKF